VATERSLDGDKSEVREGLAHPLFDWFQTFVDTVNDNIVGAVEDLAPGAGVSDLHAVAARAVIAAYGDAGVSPDQALELLGKAAVEILAADMHWDEIANSQRFELIDRELQGTLTFADKVHLEAVTFRMREHLEASGHLPMNAALALHRQLRALGRDGDTP